MIASQIGHFSSRLCYGAIPAAVVTSMKLHLLDLLGCAFAGQQIKTVAPVLTLLQENGGVTIWGAKRSASLRDATMVNAFISHASLMEDGSRLTGGHPACVVVPPLLGVGEVRSSSGRELIAAMTVGYETFIRLGMAVFPSITKRGFQSTAVLGSIAAAATSASVLKASPAEAAHAVAIASTLGVGLKAALDEQSLQPIQVARSTEGGLSAAILAQAGG